MLRPKTAEFGVANAALIAERREVALIGRIVYGDGAAFEALYHCFYPRLRRFLERLTRRPQLVEEILNDTMLVVWRKAHTYNQQSTVSTWIFAIAFRKALKALKRLDDPVDTDGNDELSWDGLGPDGDLMQQELRAFLSHAMSSLSVEQRAVIELTYYHGCAYREIAEIVGCPVDTVKTRMFHARRKLKTLLADCLADVR
jgi:RNA polymerase sigma factor (sigma-70 family)